MADVTNCHQVARLPNLVKSAIESADVPIKRSYLFFVLDFETIFIVSNNIGIYMSADSAFVYNFLFE